MVIRRWRSLRRIIIRAAIECAMNNCKTQKLYEKLVYFNNRLLYAQLSLKNMRELAEVLLKQLGPPAMKERGDKR